MVGSSRLDWGPIQIAGKICFKGVPQGSILGPIHFSVFINEILYFKVQYFINNYADDNTVLFICKDLYILKRVLEQKKKKVYIFLIKYFENNFMKANIEKFKAVFLGKKAYEGKIKFEKSVTVLAINIDCMLKTDTHLSKICQNN